MVEEYLAKHSMFENVTNGKISSDVLNVLKATYHDVNSGSDEFANTISLVLSRPPLFTTVRVNTMCRDNVGKVRDRLKAYLDGQYPLQSFCVNFHPSVPDVLVIPSKCNEDTAGVENGPQTGQLTIKVQADCEVIVDVICGAAVLRGAHVFAIGVLAAASNMEPGSLVSVYADVDGKCRRGLTKPFNGSKMYLGQGVARISRDALFKSEQSELSGVAVEMTLPLVASPSLNDVMTDEVFLQNLPSIICGHVLSPQPGDVILDLCSAPGGKTTHIATLMSDQGLVVAIDKTVKKVQRVIDNCVKQHLSCVSGHAYDGCRLVTSSGAHPQFGVPPPYLPERFNRVLLDAPCSALGQRPQIVNKMISSQLRSYPQLQQKLLQTAVRALKVGGVLVYSTCTVTLAENEGQVQWALQAFPELKLVSQRPYHVGGHGLAGAKLTHEQLSLVQRFDPLHDALHSRLANTYNTDTIGFFIAKFVKVASSYISTY